jgi:cell division protein FtsL
MSIGAYVVIGILIAIVLLLAFAIIRPQLKKYRIVEVKSKKKRVAKKATKRKGKYLQIRIL